MDIDDLNDTLSLLDLMNTNGIFHPTKTEAVEIFLTLFYEASPTTYQTRRRRDKERKLSSKNSHERITKNSK